MSQDDLSKVPASVTETELLIGGDDFEPPAEPGPEEEHEGTVTEDGSSQFPVSSGKGKG